MMNTAQREQLNVLIEAYADASKKLGHVAEDFYSDRYGCAEEEDYLCAVEEKNAAQKRLFDFLDKL